MEYELNVSILEVVGVDLSGRQTQSCRYWWRGVNISQDMWRTCEQVSARVLHYEHRCWFVWTRNLVPFLIM